MSSPASAHPKNGLKQRDDKRKLLLYCALCGKDFPNKSSLQKHSRKLTWPQETTLVASVINLSRKKSIWLHTNLSTRKNTTVVKFAVRLLLRRAFDVTLQNTFRREAIFVWNVWAKFQTAKSSKSTPKAPWQRETVCVYYLQEVFHPIALNIAKFIMTRSSTSVKYVQRVSKEQNILKSTNSLMPEREKVRQRVSGAESQARALRADQGLNTRN